MVFFFTSSEGYILYMGADKFENEHLIKYGLPEDIWFHVDDLSSAHVYLRLNRGQTIDHISPATLEECCQLVKANSIEGCKLRECNVIYTKWQNLHKTSDMEVGAIGYHDRRQVKKVKVVKDKIIVNRLSKTKTERFPDLAAEQEAREVLERSERKETRRQQLREEKEQRVAREEEAKMKSYSSIMRPEKMTLNSEFSATEDDSAARAAEDDFM